MFVRATKKMPTCIDCKHHIPRVPRARRDKKGKVVTDSMGRVVFDWVIENGKVFCRKHVAIVPVEFCWSVRCEYFAFNLDSGLIWWPERQEVR